MILIQKIPPLLYMTKLKIIAPDKKFETINMILDSFVDILPPSRGYSLSDVRFDIPNPTTAIFKAKLNGPKGALVWVRAWLSTEAGTLAETASPQLMAGDNVTLEVMLPSVESPQSAYMRIESAPLKTEHVVGLELANHFTRRHLIV